MAKFKLVSISLLFFFFLVYFFISIKKYSTDPCVLAHLQDVPDDTSQVIVVNLVKGFEAKVTACKRQRQSWKLALNSFPAVVGQEGVAPVGKKKEGDRKTPAGLYPLGDAFGTEPLGLKMDFKYITSDDKFIDDASHSGYNTWVRGKTDAKSYESMLIDVYKMGAVVNYNMNPVIPGDGSAIFIHLWRSIHVGTYGCIAMDEPHLSKLLHWLDKTQRPYIYISS
ncbi:L,D-transpeptidase family protein [Legionella sp. WA2022007384]